MLSATSGGQTTTSTSRAVVKGDGTQPVTVPAGSYSATVVDDVETDKLLGQSVTSESKTWLVNGVGPVKPMLSTDGETDTTQQLVSFAKG